MCITAMQMQPSTCLLFAYASCEVNGSGYVWAADYAPAHPTSGHASSGTVDSSVEVLLLQRMLSDRAGIYGGFKPKTFTALVGLEGE